MRAMKIGVALCVAATALTAAPSVASSQATWSGFTARELQATNSTGQDVDRPTWGLAAVRSGGGYQVVANNHAFATGLWSNLGSANPTYTQTDILGTALAGVTKHTHDTHGIRVADFDNDGDQDFIEFVGDACGEIDEDESCAGNRPGAGYNRYWRNNGNGTYTFVPENGTAMPFLRARAGAPFDFDGDGDLDLLAGGVHDSPPPDNQRPLILENDNASFSVAPGSENIEWFTNGAVVTDFGPGTAAELVLNNSGYWGRRFIEQGGDTVVVGDGPGRSAASQIRDWIVGDFDGDLKPEAILVRDSRTTDLGLQMMYLDLADNAASTVVERFPTGSVSDCAVGVAGDFDNDGDLDVFFGCSGTDDPNNHLFLNDGSGQFTKSNAKLPAVVQAGGAPATAENAVSLDANGDGFLDIYVGNGFETDEEADQLLLSQPNSNDWLQIDLVGVADNNDAVGAAVYVGSETEGWQVRQVGHAFHKGTDAMTLQFGLGADDAVAPILVTWPNGQVERFDNVSVNQRVSLTQGSGTATTLAALNASPVVPTDPVDPDPDPDPDPQPIPAPVPGPGTDQIVRLYQAALNRADGIDIEGLTFWVDRYQTGTSLAEIASGFMSSAEFKSKFGANPTNEVFVDKLYQNVLGRPGEPDGRAFWLGQLNSGTRSRLEVLMSFSDSQENIDRTKTSAPLTSAQSKVTRLYKALLNRTGTEDPEGLAFWTGRYNAGMSLEEMARQFTSLPEFQTFFGTNLSNTELVDLLYTNVLGRPGEASGRSFWIGELNAGARSQIQVMVAFSESKENLQGTGTAP